MWTAAPSGAKGDESHTGWGPRGDTVPRAPSAGLAACGECCPEQLPGGGDGAGPELGDW